MTSKFKLDNSNPSIGLNLSADPFAFKEGEYSFMLNGCIHGSGGKNPFIRMNSGTILSSVLPSGLFPVYNFPIGHKEICIFSVSPSLGISEIGLFDGKTYTAVVSSKDLGFKINKQIQAECDEDFNGHRIVIWVQDGAPIRAIDLNNVPYINGVLDVDALNVFKKYSYPQVKVVGVGTNGRILACSLYVTIQYADENGNGLTAWTTPKGPVYIYKDSASQSPAFINGSADREVTNKSVQLQIDNLDLSFKYYNIGIIKSFNGVRESYVVQTLPTIQPGYLYTGNIDSEVPVAIDEIIVPAATYSSARTITRSSGSILIGDLMGRMDYNLQPEISKIQLLWQTTREKYDTIDSTSANPVGGLNKMSLRRNEIYAFGLVINWNDGSKSRTYPLIPRKKDLYSNNTVITKTTDSYNNPVLSGSWDSDIITKNDDIYETGSLPERYKIYNTAFRTGTDSVNITDIGPADYGEFGYWESTEKYPLDSNVWGENAGKNIRHFMAPDFPEAPLTDGENSFKNDKDINHVYRLGLRFSNIEEILNGLPVEIKSQMAGWELVRGDRRNNKSVIASGLLYNMNYQNWRDHELPYAPQLSGSFAITGSEDDIRLYANYPLNDLRPDNNISKYPISTDVGPFTHDEGQDRYRKDVFSFVSPDTEFDKTKLLNGDLFIHNELYGVSKTVIQMMDSYPRFKHNKQDDDYRQLFYHTISVGYYNNWKLNKPGNLRRQLKEAMYLPFNAQVSGGSTGLPVHNRMRESSVLLYVNKDISNPTIPDTSRAKISDADFQCETPNDPRYRSASCFYASIISRLVNQYGSVYDTKYVSTNIDNTNVKNNTVVFSGDTFIGVYGMRRQMVYFQNVQDYIKFPDGSRGVDLKSSYNIPGTKYYYTSVPKWIADNSNSECEPGGEGTNKIPMLSTGIPYFFTESDHNIDLQLNGSGEQETFYPNMKDGSLSILKWANVVNLDKPMEHLVNKSYEEQNDLFSYQNPDPYFNPLKPVVTHYNTRTIFSLSATPENRFNNILVFKPLNYYDLRRDVGSLWDIRDIGNDRILFRMEHALFMDRKYATIPVQENKIVLGTGKLFETDPSMITKSDGGHLGTNAQWAFNNTPYGCFFIDPMRGAAYHFTENAEDISLNGVDNYLETDLPLQLLKDIPFFKEFDNPANPNGIGYISTYDSFNKYWILTKRDYSLINKADSSRFHYENDVLLYDDKPALLSDRSLFADRSFTFCYDILNKRWVGWQSFIPTMYCTLQKDYYSFSEGAYWQHNKGLPRTYYGKRYPFVFEGVIKHDGGNSLSHACTWISRAFPIKNMIQQGESNILTFNKGIFYNTNQCTGLIELTVQDENDLSQVFKLERTGVDFTERYLRKREIFWQVSELYDMVADPNVPFFVTTPKHMEAVYFIDKVLNNSNINYKRDYKSSTILSDLWLKYRLIYDKEEDIQLYLYLALELTEQVVL